MARTKTAVDLLIFDFDGTLIESKWDIATAVNLTLRELSLPSRSQEEIFGFVGDGVKRLLRLSVGEENLARYEEALKVFRGHYLTHCLDRTCFYPGVETVLTHFAGKHKAIATNKALEYTTKILQGLGPHHFAYVVGGDNGFGLKPEPGMLLKIMEALNVLRDRTVLIGDSTNDITGGHNAGIRVCAVGYGMGNREKMAACKPDWFIEKPEELIELFT
ncbi:MAG TPA: HAD-IA family hydrolase [Nitrospiraceae bacterium]|jgi:phosphoglycolate phosphatase|nr:HAD-IA family hydrolase [Nitrospiraceae bacterium]